jgi:hypothetical protein
VNSSRFLVVAASVAVVVALAGCSGKPVIHIDADPPSKAQLCNILKSHVATDALPHVGLKTVDTTGAPAVGSSRCDLSGASGNASYLALVVSKPASSIKAVAAINTEVVKNVSQCLSPSSLPKVTMGGSAETSLICSKSNSSVFTYLGEFGKASVELRVTRPISSGRITSEDAQKWLDSVGRALDHLSTKSTSPASQSGARGSGSLPSKGLCTWVGKVLQHEPLMSGLPGATFGGTATFKEQPSVTVIDCYATPEILSTGNTENAEGQVWIEMREPQSSTGPSGSTIFSYHGVSGYSFANERVAHLGQLELYISIGLDPSNVEIPLNADEPFTTNLTHALIDQWNSGVRP